MDMDTDIIIMNIMIMIMIMNNKLLYYCVFGVFSHSLDSIIIQYVPYGVLYCIVLYCIVLYCIVLYCIVE